MKRSSAGARSARPSSWRIGVTGSGGIWRKGEKIVRLPIDMLDRTFSASRVEELGGTPVYSIVSGPDRLLGLAAKRCLDILLSAIALVLLSPLLLGVALWVRSHDGSPVLFRHKRVGLHGRLFQVLKFRTMGADAETRY